MRPVYGLFAASLILFACSPEARDDGNTAARSPITDDEASQQASDTDTIEAVSRPGPDRADEVGFGWNKGQAIGNAARSDFENFLTSTEGVSVERNVAAIDGELRADRLTMDFNTFFGIYRNDIPVEAGSRFEGQVTLWSESGPASFVLQLSDFCSQNGADIESVSIEVDSEPTEYNIGHTFERSHTCALLRVTNVTEGGAEIYAADARLVAN